MQKQLNTGISPNSTQLKINKEEVISNSKITRNSVKFADLAYKSHEAWLSSKRSEDAAEGLWRVHDDLYDLERFLHKHPGGRSWLVLTKGTDITEAYETHHFDTDKTNAILRKYLVRKASEPRNFKLTFHENGFYCTLRRRVAGYLNERAKLETFWTKERLTNIFIDALLITTFLCSILSTYLTWFIAPAAVSLTWVVIAGHNYIHRRDSFRMYYFNLNFLSFEEWRISHCLSHHMYPNSLVDMEMHSLEPLISWSPNAERKNLVTRYASWVYGPFIWCMYSVAQILKRITHHLFVIHQWSSSADLVPLTIPLAMFVFGGASLGSVLTLWIVMLFGSSFGLALIGLHAGHHHPDAFHDGDETRTDMDWGIYQLDTTIDRSDVQQNHFLAVTQFGDHILHHLFPTLDHGILNELHPILRSTTAEFGVESRFETFPKLLVGQVEQLARIHSSPRCRLEEEIRPKRILESKKIS